MSTTVLGKVTIKSACKELLIENFDRIAILFSAKLIENCDNNNKHCDDIRIFNVHSLNEKIERSLSSDFITRLQNYVDDICAEGCKGAVGGEDSSYDSDYEADIPSIKHHQDVSRTTSDTLAAEYAEYVQSTPETYPGYTARVEFALKLGYTEKLVQAALQKLGPSPAQNELLAELIKLGAQKGINSCDNSPSDNLLDDIQQHQQQQQQDLITNQTNSDCFRPIVIDGSNVAMSHGNKEIFSCRGIKICVDWFKQRGHKDITVFVPKWRKESPRLDNQISDQDILAELEKERLLVFTPSRFVGGKRMVCYDDRYILKLAAEVQGIVVSNDNYRDLCQENTEFRKVIEERILMYSFVNDRFMPPDDPLGRSGPTLDNFLRLPSIVPLKKLDPPPQLCPYGKKCTYGNKCKFHHPERGPLPHKSVTERLFEHAQRHLLSREGDIRKLPLGRTRSNIPPPKDTTTQHTIVSKSRSVDNVGNISYTITSQQQQQQQQQQKQQPENLHRKLQRQLTLNPTSDPRLVRRFLPQTTQQQLQGYSLASTSHHLSTSSSTTTTSAANWDLHQHVTRIASAPESYRPWPPTSNNHSQQTAQNQQQQQQQQQHKYMQRMSSCSDPQLNIWHPQLWSQLPQTSTNQIQQQSLNLQEDARRNLYYHLSAIFPEEQVAQVMQMYPDETNPQKICAAILSMFPKS